MALLEVQNLSKTFPSKQALKGVSFNVDDAEIFVVVGPNGAGKTTLLRLIDLLDEPTGGKIYFDGVDTGSNSKAKLSLRRRIGMVFQRTVLFNASVWENLAYGLKVRGMSEEAIRVSVRDVLEMVGFTGFERRNALTLSGGEAQMVALAQVLATRPELLLLDEPTANLDPKSVVMIEQVIARANHERGATIILATHNMFQARRLGQKAAFLLDGEIVEQGVCQDIFTKPRDRRTEAFIRGDMIC